MQAFNEIKYGGRVAGGAAKQAVLEVIPLPWQAVRRQDCC
jgi:hypothetical protein